MTEQICKEKQIVVDVFVYGETKNPIQITAKCVSTKDPLESFGYASVQKENDSTWRLALIDVDTEYRGQGIGRAMVHGILKKLPPDTRVYVKGQTGLWKFYKRIGFTEAPHRGFIPVEMVIIAGQVLGETNDLQV